MLVRSAERAPYSAPQTASASADISVLMKVVSICRSRSGLAWASCSSRKRTGSILLGAVIASNSWGCERYPEDHAVAASTCRARYSPGPSHTTLVDATQLSARGPTEDAFIMGTSTSQDPQDRWCGLGFRGVS